MKLRKRYAQYDAVLNTDLASLRTNADLLLTMRMGFRQINPDKGAKTGSYHDYGRSDEPTRKIIKWTDAEWKAWKTNFCKSAQNYWNGKFWIDNRLGAFPIRVGKEIAIPNIYCQFELIGSDASEGTHHHVIEVVRLDDSEPWFGSHAQLYDSKDTIAVQKGSDSKGKPIMQRAHVHEVGHLLGLGHVAIGQKGCPASGDTNIAACYGVTDQDKRSVMGEGMRLDVRHASPWVTTFKDFAASHKRSPLYVPPKGKARPPVALMKRIYPRTVAEFESGAVLTALPKGR